MLFRQQRRHVRFRLCLVKRQLAGIKQLEENRITCSPLLPKLSNALLSYTDGLPTANGEGRPATQRLPADSAQAAWFASPLMRLQSGAALYPQATLT